MFHFLYGEAREALALIFLPCFLPDIEQDTDFAEI